MRVIQMKGIDIGCGIPKICVPIVARKKEEILQQCRILANLPVDIAELRIDWFEQVEQFSKVEELLHEVTNIIKDKVIMFTFRSKREGGECQMPFDRYEELLLFAAKYGKVDIIDVEAFWNIESSKRVQSLIEQLHNCNVVVIASNHDFEKTPEEDEIIRRLHKMKELGADIAKIAAMPEGDRDVITLLAATERMKQEKFDIPVVTISMGDTGKISRITGAQFGSAITFASAQEASAPGQIPFKEMQQLLQILN